MKLSLHKLTQDNFASNTLLAEQSTLFMSVFKWSVLASVTGVIVGLITSMFLYLLKVFSKYGNIATNGHSYYLLPLIIPLVIFIISKLAPSKGDDSTESTEGTEKVIEAVHKHDGAIDVKVVPIKLFATLLTLGSGGSVGKEGPAAQIGAGVAYSIARLLRLNRADAKRLVICGISGGFAAVFGTPISGAIFGAEVLYLGLLKYDVMFPCLVAGVVAHAICRAERSAPVIASTPGIIAKSHVESVFIALGSGVFFGLVALALIQALKLSKMLKERIKLNPMLTGFLGGLLLIGLFSISPQSSGLGTKLLTQLFSNNKIPTFTALWKILATSLTIGAGGSGGVITPLYVIGGTSGYALARLFGTSPIMMGAFGMVALVSAGAGTPIAASVMALELFGPEIGTYAAIACCTAYIVVGHRSVYPSQILGASKSASIELTEPDVRIDEMTEDGIRPKRQRVFYLFNSLMRHKKNKK